MWKDKVRGGNRRERERVCKGAVWSLQLFALPATHTHTLAYTCSLITAIGVAVLSALSPLPSPLNVAGQFTTIAFHAHRTWYSSAACQHICTWIAPRRAAAKRPAGSELGPTGQRGRGCRQKGGRGCLSNCCSLYANFYAYSICMSCIKKGQSVRQKTKKIQQEYKNL